MRLEETARYVSPGINQIQVEMYGFGEELRRYCYLPSKFPLRVKSQHGIVFWNTPSLHELTTELPFMLVFSKRHQNSWKKHSKKPCFIIKHPFHLYRKRKNLTPKEDRSGSLFFLSHSTFSKETDIDFVEIISKLKDLPEEFKPIAICLHFVDVLKNKHLLFEDAGFHCVTAGHMFNKNFISNFYEILINFKYTLSNDIGSHTFYSIDLGIPFSLIGSSAQQKISQQEENENILLEKNLEYQAFLENLINRNKLNYTITPELHEKVREELGIRHGLARFKLGIVLLISSIVYFTSKAVEKLIK